MKLGFLLAALAGFACHAEFVVVDEGRANAVVALGDEAQVTKFAAKELCKYVKAMSGAELAVVKDGEFGGKMADVRIRVLPHALRIVRSY